MIDDYFLESIFVEKKYIDGFTFSLLTVTLSIFGHFDSHRFYF